MSEPMNLNEFISLGQSLCIISNPQPWHVNLVADEIGKVLHQLTVCGMTRTRIAAQPLDGISIPYNTRTGFIGGVALKQLQAYMGPVLETLSAEAREQEIVAIDTGGVSQRLRDVPKTLTFTDSQQQLRDETISCLERGAYRAAIVMGWCFAYDVIRWWAFNDTSRLQEFNNKLATFTKGNGNRLYDDIVNYEEFYSSKAPAEGRVIEICELSGLIGGRLARNLRHYLDVRNDYAHATSSQPTRNQANAFIEHLLDIVTSSPFH